MVATRLLEALRYKAALAAPIELVELNANLPRVLRAIEEVLAARPLKQGSFGHFRPARYFMENLDKLTAGIDAATKVRFEEAFKRLNALLK